MIRLIGPGGAGKSTIGALLAQRLGVPFLDLDRHVAGRVGDISEYIGRHGYAAYARENIEAYCSLFRGETRPDVVALSSGFMTYASDAHPEYGRVRRELEECAHTFILLPSLDRELCVAETVRRQVARPFGRSPEREEAVIRARFEIYEALPIRRVETMRPAAAIVDEILAALSPEVRCCSMADALSPTMTLRDFENGYWYLDELNATRAEAIAAWTELKELAVPEDYASWIKVRAKRKGKSR